MLRGVWHSDFMFDAFLLEVALDFPRYVLAPSIGTESTDMLPSFDFCLGYESLEVACNLRFFP